MGEKDTYTVQRILSICPVSRRIDKVWADFNSDGSLSELWREPVIAAALYREEERSRHTDEFCGACSRPYVGLLSLNPTEGVDNDHIDDYGGGGLDRFLGYEFDGVQREWKEEIARCMKAMAKEKESKTS